MASRQQALDIAILAIPVVVTLAPFAVILAIHHRDKLTRLRTRAERYLTHYPGLDVEALQQVQREISLMEHGEYGGADAC